MTIFSGAGTKDWAGALAELSRGGEVIQRSDGFISFRTSFGGEDYVISLGAVDGKFDWPGGSPSGGELPKGAVGSIQISNLSTLEPIVIGSPPKISVADLLEFGSAKQVNSFLFAKDDTFGGNDGADRFDGLGGDDTFNGAGGKDTISGGAGRDSIEGEAGADRLSGGGGGDTLVGGLASDRLTGGGGDDVFLFETAKDSGPAADQRDVITDFDRGADLIGLALPTGSGAGFDFIGKGSFDAAFQVRYETDKSGSIVFVNLDEDAKAEFSIRIEDVGRLTAQDFII